MKIKQLLAYVIALAVILTSMTLAVSAAWNGELPEGFSVTAQNEKFALALHEETGVFGVIARQSGHIWWSNPQGYSEGDIMGRYAMEIQSQIIIRYLNVNLNISEAANSAAHAVRKGGFRIDRRDTGFTLTYTFTYTTAKTTAKGTFSFLDFIMALFGKKSDKEALIDTQSTQSSIEIPLRIDLTENGIRAEVKDEEIKETGDIVLLDLGILPYFNAGAPDEEGYIFLPDGSGAVMEFNNGKMTAVPYEGQVYGRNQAIAQIDKSLEETMIPFPVFGVKKAGTAMFTLIENSAASASLMARPNGLYTPYACVYAQYRLRSSDTYRNDSSAVNQTFEMFNLEKRETEDIRQQYHLLDDSAAGLPEMAAITADAIGNPSKKPETGVLLNVTGGIYPKDNIMGMPVHLEKTLTTFDECADMVKALSSENGTDIAVHYQNWTTQGIQQRIQDSVSPDGSLGGTKGLNRLLDGSARVYLGFTLNSYKRGGVFAKLTSAARTIYRSAALVPEFYPSIYLADIDRKENILLNAGEIEKSARSIQEGLTKFGGAGVSLNGLSDYVYGDYRKGGVVTPNELVQTYRLAFEQCGEKATVMSDYANFYAMGYTNLILQTPATSSGHTLFSYDVPFYQMVVSRFAQYGASFLNQAASPETEFLRCLSVGALPSFDFIANGISGLDDTEYSRLASSLFSAYADRAKDMIRRSRELYAQIEDTTITGYEHLSDGVTRTMFQSGERLLVNLSDADYTDGNLSVPAMSYLLEGGAR